MTIEQLNALRDECNERLRDVRLKKQWRESYKQLYRACNDAAWSLHEEEEERKANPPPAPVPAPIPEPEAPAA